MARNNNLYYYVYVESINQRKIVKYNVLNDGIVAEIKDRVKKQHISDKKKFEESVQQILMYHYWSKSEYEIILTSWPPRITIEEYHKLERELAARMEEMDREPYSMCASLSVAEKIDVYDQVMLNWNIFIDYLWENLK
jgi:hypothetical protein